MASEFSCVQVPREESKEDSASQQQPSLMISYGKNCHIQNSMFNTKPLHNCYYYDVGREIPDFFHRYILCSYREWVVLDGCHYTGVPHVLVNLLSKETIHLPFLNFYSQFCVLTSPPSDPTCRIVFFHEENNSLLIWHPGDRKFTIKRLDSEIFPGKVFAAAAVAGKLFLDMRTSRYGECVLVMVEFNESTCRLEVVQMDPRETSGEYMDFWRYFFFEYSGELFAVDMITCGSHSQNVAGFKISKKWVRMKNLGRLAVFFGRGAAHAHSVAVDSGIAANSVYFVEQDNDHASCYVYNLEDGSIRMKPFFNSMEAEKYIRLDWIMMHGDPPFPNLLKDDDQECIRQDSEEENGEVQQDDEVQESWNMVPPELLDLIQSRLFGRDHAVFRGVCRAWQKSCSIQDCSIPSFLLEQCQTSSPLLMYQEDLASSCDSGPIFRFFDPVHRKLYRTRIPELNEADIQYSSDGWLLVVRSGDGSIFFINPLTQEKIELPRMPPRLSHPDDMHEFRGFLSFSSPPTCSNCLVFGMDYRGWTIYTLKHGDQTWREYGLNFGLRDWCNIVVLNGLHYFMCESKKYKDMLVFDVNAEGQAGVSQSWPQMLRRSKSLDEEDFLVEIDGVLALVSIAPNGGEISIIKWNDMEKDWELMEGDVDFGGKQMFLSKRGSFMEKIDDVGAMGNTIFLPIIEDAKFGVFYSLTTRRYYTFYSGYSSELPYNVDEFPNGVWVKPDRKIVGHNNLKWSFDDRYFDFLLLFFNV